MCLYAGLLFKVRLQVVVKSWWDSFSISSTFFALIFQFFVWKFSSAFFPFPLSCWLHLFFPFVLGILWRLVLDLLGFFRVGRSFVLLQMEPDYSESASRLLLSWFSSITISILIGSRLDFLNSSRLAFALNLIFTMVEFWRILENNCTNKSTDVTRCCSMKWNDGNWWFEVGGMRHNDGIDNGSRILVNIGNDSEKTTRHWQFLFLFFFSSPVDESTGRDQEMRIKEVASNLPMAICYASSSDWSRNPTTKANRRVWLHHPSSKFSFRNIGCIIVAAVIINII